MTRGKDIPATGGMQRFAAFISYSHADDEVAARLQRKLERYRLPKHVALADEGQAARLGQVFRDREDLAAAPSLSDAIREALAQAGALIVICSPEAKNSRWVSDEIALFRQLHPDRPILAALVRGEPVEAFPATLSADGIEPLAADLRNEGDGWSLGFLKIVAGIAAVPLDALVQRDAQRRIRRVTWITLGAVAAMLVMGIMTAFAISARNEAARQRASAEGLVEYMLTDLRDKLKGVGRLDVMDSVNHRAMEHYRRQGDLGALPADSLDRRARILHAMGEDDDRSGNLNAALAKFREAHRTTAALLTQEPGNPDRIFAHAQSEYWVGRAAWRLFDRKATERHWDAYLAQGLRLIEFDPDKARANLETGYAYGNLCELFMYDGFDVAKAIRYCRLSIAYEQKALQIAPDRKEIRMALANRYGWLADALLAGKGFSEALAARNSEREIVNRLAAADPRNFELRFRQLWPDFGIARIKLEEGRNREAAAELAVLASKIAKLSAAEPGNVEVKRAWARALYTRSTALVDIDRQAARLALLECRKLLEEISVDPVQRQAQAGFWKAIGELETSLLAGGKKQ